MHVLYPIGSMYAIYGNIYHQYTPNASIYTIHGSYGYWYVSWLEGSQALNFGSVLVAVGLFSFNDGGSLLRGRSIERPPGRRGQAPSGGLRPCTVEMGKSAGKSWMCSVVVFWGRGCHHELIWINYRCIHIYAFCCIFKVYTYVLIIDHEFPDCFKRCY